MIGLSAPDERFIDLVVIVSATGIFSGVKFIDSRVRNRI